MQNAATQFYQLLLKDKGFYKMEQIREMIKKLKITKKDEETFRKVKKAYALQDLLVFLEDNGTTEQAMKDIVERIDRVLDKYDEFLCEDWYSAISNAIDYVLS